MAKRLHGTYYNLDSSYQYTIEIYDNQYTGQSEEVQFRGNAGIVYTFEGVQRNQYKWIMPTSASITFEIRSSTQLVVVQNMIDSDEGRFWIKVNKGSDIDFIGEVQPRQASYDDVDLAVGIGFSISAIDGLSKLKSLSYEAAASKNYIKQEQTGRFRVAPSNQVYHSKNETVRPWNLQVENHGGAFDISNRYFETAGRYGFNVYVSVFADVVDYVNSNGVDVDFLLGHGTEGFEITMRIYKIDVNNAEVNLEDPKTLFFFMLDEGSQAVTDLRVTESISIADVEVLEGERVICEFRWDYDDDFIRYDFESTGYWESIVDASQTIEIAHGSVLEHVGNILSQLPTYDYYDTGYELLGMFMTHVEANQGSFRAEDYIGLPYNAFVTDYGTAPIKTISAYDALIEICKLVCGQMIYRSGQYLLHPFHSATSFNIYNKAFQFQQFEAKSFSSLSMQCIGRSIRSHLGALRAFKVCFDRLSSLNLLDGVSAYFPSVAPNTIYTTAPIDMRTVPYKLHIIVRVKSVIKPAALRQLETNNDRWRHAFVATLKVGDQYLKVPNTNSFKHAPAVYDTATYSSDSDNVVDIHGGLQAEIKEHTIEVSFELPVLEYNGPLEFNIQYDTTYVRDTALQYIEVPIPLILWSLDLLRLSESGADDPNELYNSTVCTEISKEANSRDISISIAFSDLVEVESDGGAIAVWSGSDWVKGGTWSGDSLQMRIAKLLSNPAIKTPNIHTGSFSLSDYMLGHAQTSSGNQYLLISGAYNTKMNELSGSWVKYDISERFGALTAKTYLEASANSVASDKTNTVRDNPILTGGGVVDNAPNETVLRPEYEYYTDSETDIYVDLPATVELPDPSLFTPAQLMRMFDGSKRGSGNYVYRSNPVRPEHFSIDFANHRLVLGRPASLGQELFFMWYIMQI